MNRIALLAALVLAAAPAAAQSADEIPLPVSVYLDSAALHQALLAAPPAPEGFARKLIVAVTLDTLGGVPAVDVVGRRHVPAAYADGVAALVRAHLRPQGRIARERTEWVWLRSGHEPHVESLRDAVEARPVLSNRSHVAQELGKAAQAIVNRHPYLAGRTSHVQLRMRISDAGVPERIVILRGADAVITREAGRVAQRMRFRPAQVEGYPVSVLVEIPIDFSFPAPSPTEGGGMPRP